MKTEETTLNAGHSAVRILAGGLLWIAAAVTFMFLPLTAMAGDGCFEGDRRAICTVTGQSVVACLPMVTAPVAALLGTWGLATRRGVGVGAYMAGFLLIAAAWAVDTAIAG